MHTLSESASAIISFMFSPSYIPFSFSACSSSSIVMNLEKIAWLSDLLASSTLKVSNKKLSSENSDHIPAVILIKVLERRVQMLLSVHSVQVHRCSNEFVVVYRSISICICLLLSSNTPRFSPSSFALQHEYIHLSYRQNEILTASSSCLTSTSGSLVPCLESPCFNSSSVIVPLLSVSMLLNISFRPLISSSDKHPATTYTFERSEYVICDM